MKFPAQKNHKNETGLIIRKDTLASKVSRVFSILFYKDIYNLNKKLDMIMKCNYRKPQTKDIVIPNEIIKRKNI